LEIRTEEKKNFLYGEDYKWNLFDLVLVITGLYDFIMETLPSSDTDGGGGMGVTWLRVLRLLKMVKMLRVVRVMRFFKVLRMMVASIIGSMSTLFWSVLMLAIMLYMFGLCFLQAVASYLQEAALTHSSGAAALTAEEMIDAKAAHKDVVMAIEQYWGGVGASAISLYMAVTGGADWENIAFPIKASGIIYYSLFLFYTAFASLAVLNVLTGMFVDAAMKISSEDDQSVIDEIADRPEIHEFKMFFAEKMQPQAHPHDHEHPHHHDHAHAPEEITISCKLLELCKDNPVIQNFFNLIELSVDEGVHIYKLLDTERNDKLNIEEFIGGCFHAKGTISCLDMVTLMSEQKRFAKQFLLSMEYIEDRFDQIDPPDDNSQASTTQSERVQPLKSRWEMAKVLSHTALHHAPRDSSPKA